MTNEDIINLTLSLAKAETEKEVVQVLNNFNVWEDESAWKEIDESQGNWSTIGNQQSAPDTALVEKIINSVDAVLMRECLRRGVRPDSDMAPKNIAEAQKKYFDIYNGKLSLIDASQRSKIAENIFLIASGEKGTDSNPSYSIVDFGEGQSPEAFPHTFLSLNKGNKSKIQFVQGKFGMGGTGVFRFGSPEHNLQLIISKRDPVIKEENKNDKWGMTVVRRKNPIGQMRSSIFVYLAPKGEILSFNSLSLSLLPGQDLQPYKNPLTHGTFIKIYEYQIGTGRLRSDATRHLHNRLSLLMPNIALPIKVVDVRYEKSPLKILSGLSVRLDEDKRENLEDNFPSSGELVTRGQKMDYSIFAFKAGKRDTYANQEGIIFIVNGQTHGFLSKSFFERQSVRMGYLADSILVMVDCSKINGRTQEDLFMNSRDRLSGGPIQEDIETCLEDIIKNHQGLRDLREKRRREDIENQLQDSKPLADVLENIIKKSPSLSSLFMKGIRIKNPFKLTGVKSQGIFKGKEFPTYFKLDKEYTESEPKICPINNIRFRVQYETDSENNYFNRDKDPGELILKMNDISIRNRSINLWNGVATLTIEMPDDVKIGDKLCFQTEVTDTTRVEPFESRFCIIIGRPQDNDKGNNKGKRKKSPDKKKGSDRQELTYLDIPNIREVRKDEWEKYKFNEKTALHVIDAGEEAGYDFYINMDNVYLQMETKGNIKIDPKILEARFKYGMVLIGISLIDFDKKTEKETISQNTENIDISIFEKISQFSRAISPVLLPLIASLGDLEVEQ